MNGVRAYTKVRRAEAEARTRERIIAALMALHEEVGPSRTTISAVAERAGVERLTVYRHFPDEDAMIRACSSRWAESHPPPAVPQRTYRDPLAGCRATLLELYRWYRKNARMLGNVTSDLDRVPAIRAAFAGAQQHVREIADALEAQWPRRSRRRLATLHHAVEFTTWRSLHRATGGDRQAVALVIQWLRSG